MLKKLSTPKKEDICPNCGTACFATDVLCPQCGKNLDDLFEQLPDSNQANDFFKMASKNLPFLNWLTPLLLLLSPFIVSLITVLRVALYMTEIRDQIPFQRFWHADLIATLSSSGFLLISAIPPFLCTASFICAKIGQRLMVILAISFSILSGMALWLGLSTANIMSMVPFRMGFYNPFIPEDWVYFFIAGGIILIVLNLMVAIGKGKAA
jgi:hypothetical protein